MHIAGAVLWLTAAQVSPNDTTLRVVTYNIHHGEGIDGQLDLDRIAGVIRALEPDVVCLQEVDRNLSRTDRIDMPAYFEKALEMAGVFESNYDFDGGEYGNATFSRHPIAKHYNVSLPGEADNEPRGCLHTQLEIGGQRVHVLNTHLALTPNERKQQAGAIIDYMPEGPVILAGDLNETPDAQGIAILLGALRDPVAMVGESKSPTSPSRAPRRRIDYVLASPQLTPVETQVVDTEVTRVASDHLPVLTVFQLSEKVSPSEATGINDTDDERIDDALGGADDR